MEKLIDISSYPVANVLDLPRTTLGWYMNKPDAWRYGDLKRIARVLEVPLEWLMSEHRNEVKEEVTGL